MWLRNKPRNASRNVRVYNNTLGLDNYLILLLTTSLASAGTSGWTSDKFKYALPKNDQYELSLIEEFLSSNITSHPHFRIYFHISPFRA